MGFSGESLTLSKTQVQGSPTERLPTLPSNLKATEATHTLPPTILFHVNQPVVKQRAQLHSRRKAKIQLMTPIFKSQLRLKKRLIQEIFLSESFHEL